MTYHIFQSLFVFGITTGVAISAVVQFLYYTFSGPSPDEVAFLPSPAIEAQQDVPKSNSRAAIQRLEDQFYVSTVQLQDMVKLFVHDMQRGLKRENALIKMLPSYVTKRPTGNERGTYLALDLGGTNFRVCEVTFATGQVRTKQRKFTVSDELKTGPGHLLFDFFADCVALFLDENGIPRDTNMKLGFTFSFPCHQEALNRGRLIRWTKGFTASGVVGEDVVKLLQDAFHRKGLSINVTALVNDTVGTLISHAYIDPLTQAGIILGTGSNAAYVERISEIKKWDGPKSASNEMVINMEWGNWGSDKIALPLTAYDLKVDRASPNPGQQLYEKMISGMYLGEITRYIMLDLISTGELFRGQRSVELEKPYNFDTANMSRIERDHTTDMSDTNMLLKTVYNIDSTLKDRRNLKQICQLVSTRAARLAAVGISAIVTKTNRLNGATVGIDGSVYEHYQHFGNHVKDALRELLGMVAQNVTLAQGEFLRCDG
ncbi:glucokinase [Rhizophlyctis rosea]|uniref:Phosphotransferase n=1 Tax=Rhizophlyctis rosea TaxID=64517 RepID=A0AAD5SFY0_9FUNG|nr:glucokinase [Rhizophlyctis rosea]